MEGPRRKETEVVVHTQLLGHLFEVDLRAPRVPAKVWQGDHWGHDGLTNEDVLFHPEAEAIDESRLELVKVVSLAG
jgi:hypothetical protein